MLLFLCLLLSATAFAHNLPSDFTVQVFLKPEANALHVQVSAPLANVGASSEQWFNGFLELRENDRPLRNPRLVEQHISSTQVTLQFDYPIQSPTAAFAIRTGMNRQGFHVVTAVKFLPVTGGIRAYEFLDDSSLVTLDPRWYQAASRFVVMGFRHILDGADHLLFLLCLVIPVRRFRRLIPVVTAFTVAHSITLIASASGFAPNAPWFPPLIEVLIAASIVYMAVENMLSPGNTRHRWITAFAFGLVHGFGFSFILRNTLQFAGAHLLTSLISFNLGVELGQIFALLLAIPVLDFLFRRVTGERTGTLVLSFAVAVTGTVWLVRRAGQLTVTADLIQSLFWFVAIAGGLWIVAGLRQRRKSA